MKKHIDLFSGLGGFSFAVDMVWGQGGVEHIFCDNNLFSQAVIKKHWPQSKIYGDIRDIKKPETAYLVTGGFPCQPFSNSGRRKGTDDNRYLWPEMFRVIRASNPTWVVAENVFGLITWNSGLVLDTVLSDLETAGYEAWPLILPACAADAPHRRDRVWIVAHANNSGRIHGQTKKQPTKRGQQAQRKFESSSKNISNTNGFNVERSDAKTEKGRKNPKRPFGLRDSAGGGIEKWAVEPKLGRVAHGISNRVDRIESLGNAIVPQVAAQIFRAIKKIDHE